MNSHLTYAVAQSRRQDMLRQAKQPQAAAETLNQSRGSRFRLPLPRTRVATRPAPSHSRATRPAPSHSQATRPAPSQPRIAGI
jgi:hypothetical protein